MNKLITTLVLVMAVSVNAFAQSKLTTTSQSDARAMSNLPKFVQEMSEVHHEYIEDIDYSYTWQHRLITWGTGTYRLTEGREIQFIWVSYQNDDDWFQVELNTRVYSFDLAPIRQIPDTLKRKNYETKVENKQHWTTWIGTSNDWGFDAGMYTDGRRLGLIDQFPLDTNGHVDMVAVTRYYLAKVSAATPALQFEVKGQFDSK